MSGGSIGLYASTPKLPFKIPHMPTNRDRQVVSRATLGV